MYSTDFELPPSRLVTKSFSAAQQEFRLWLLANDFSQMKDKAGHPWQVVMSLKEMPSRENRRINEYHLELSLRSRLGAEDLTQEGTLERERDARLLALISDAEIPVIVKSKTLQDKSLRSLRIALGDQVRRWQSYLSDHPLHEVKRQLVGQWIDRQSRFENRALRPEEEHLP